MTLRWPWSCLWLMNTLVQAAPTAEVFECCSVEKCSRNLYEMDKSTRVSLGGWTWNVVYSLCTFYINYKYTCGILNLLNPQLNRKCMYVWRMNGLWIWDSHFNSKSSLKSIPWVLREGVVVMKEMKMCRTSSCCTAGTSCALCSTGLQFRWAVCTPRRFLSRLLIPQQCFDDVLSLWNFLSHLLHRGFHKLFICNCADESTESNWEGCLHLLFS